MWLLIFICSAEMRYPRHSLPVYRQAQRALTSASGRRLRATRALRSTGVEGRGWTHLCRHEYSSRGPRVETLRSHRLTCANTRRGPFPRALSKPNYLGRASVESTTHPLSSARALLISPRQAPCAGRSRSSLMACGSHAGHWP